MYPCCSFSFREARPFSFSLAERPVDENVEFIWTIKQIKIEVKSMGQFSTVKGELRSSRSISIIGWGVGGPEGGMLHGFGMEWDSPLTLLGFRQCGAVMCPSHPILQKKALGCSDLPTVCSLLPDLLILLIHTCANEACLKFLFCLGRQNQTQEGRREEGKG